jgi:hypothetical protein
MKSEGKGNPSSRQSRYVSILQVTESEDILKVVKCVHYSGIIITTESKTVILSVHTTNCYNLVNILLF